MLISFILYIAILSFRGVCYALIHFTFPMVFRGKVINCFVTNGGTIFDTRWAVIWITKKLANVISNQENEYFPEWDVTNDKENLLERRFGSVLGAWCIIRIVVSKIVWKIDFIEIIICGSGHRIRPRSSRHVSILFFFIAINLSYKTMRKSVLVKCNFRHL